MAEGVAKSGVKRSQIASRLLIAPSSRCSMQLPLDARLDARLWTAP